MERIYPIIAAIIAIGLFLGWLLEPGITLLAGIAIWVFLGIIYSGAEDPNPHRTSFKLHRGIPDSPMVKLALKEQPKKKKMLIPARLVMIMFLTGLFLVVIGYIWIK